MTTVNRLTGLVHQLRRRCGDGPTDGDLLADFAARRDESAFAELVRRHGGLVMGVARRHLPDRQSAEDVVQATFLSLSRSASRLGRPPSLVNWLYTVSLRQARKARLRFARRSAVLNRMPPPLNPPDPLAEVSGRELVTIIDDELARLPAAYCLPLLLCAVEGLSREEAARRLGWPIGSVKGRLERGRELLRNRLAKRGLTVPAVLVGGLLTTSPAEALPAGLVSAMTRAAVAMPAAAGTVRVLAAALLTFAGLGIAVGAAVWPSHVQDGPLTPPAQAAVESEPRIDALGDPLPAGAVARLGTQRFRPGATVKALAYSPDGRRLACWSETNNLAARLIIWDSANGRELRRLDLPHAQLIGFHWLADGRGVAVLRMAEDDYYIWNFADESTAPPPPRPDAQLHSSKSGDLLGVAISTNGRWLATGKMSYTAEPQPIELWDLAVNRPLSALESRVLGQQPGHGYKLAFSPDSRILYALSRTQEPDSIRLPPPGGGPMPSVPGKQADQARLVGYDIASGRARETRDLPAPAGGGSLWSNGGDTFVPTPDGTGVVTGHSDGTVRVWNIADWSERRSWTAYTPNHQQLRVVQVGSQAFAGNRTLVTVSAMGMLRFWDLTTGKPIGMAHDLGTNVVALAASPDGKSVAAGGAVGNVGIWDADTGARRTPPPGHTTIPNQIYSSLDSRTAMTSAGRTVLMWDLASGREIRCVNLDAPGLAWPTGFTPNGHGLVGSDISGAAGYGIDERTYSGRQKFFWDTETGKQKPLPELLADPRLWLLTGPEHGTVLGIDPHDQSVTLRDWPSGRVRQTFTRSKPEAPDRVCRTAGAAVSADGRLVAVIAEEQQGTMSSWGRVSLFKATDGRMRWSQADPDALRRHVAILPDGSGIIVGGITNSLPITIRFKGQVARPQYKPEHALVLLNSDTGERIRSFTPTKLEPFGHRWINALAVSPDGRQLAAAEYDFSIWVYEVATGNVRRQLAGHDNEVTALAFTPDGRKLVSTSRDLTGLVWDVSLAASGRAGPKLQSTAHDRLWADLAKLEWEIAGPALATLATQPEAAVAFLQESLKPATRADGADPAALAILIDKLNSNAFAERQQSTVALRRHGSDALPAVRERLGQPASAEMKQRLTRLVEDIQASPLPANRLRELRAVEVLEQLATPAARNLLKSLSNGASGATLTRAAADALKRLTK